MEEYVSNKEEENTIYQHETESFLLERTSNHGTESYCFSSLKTVKSKQITNSVDKHIMNDNSSIDVLTSFKNISSYISSNKPEIPFKSNQQESITPIVPKIDFTENQNEDGMSVLYYYPESPLYYPVPTLHINEGANPISKEIKVDRNYQDLEVKDGYGSFEEQALQELVNFQKVPFDFAVPKLLINEIINPSSKENTVYHNVYDNEINKEERSYEVEALPEIDIREAPIDFHIPSYIDETVNRFSKEKNVDLNYEGMEVKDGLRRSYEVLPELDITEAPVDFPVPRLHSDETIYPLTREKMISLKSEGIVIRKCAWSLKEEAILRRNYMDFLKQYRIHDGRVLFIRNSFQLYSQKMKFLKAKHFYVRLGKDINERTLISIYRKARRMFL